MELERDVLVSPRVEVPVIEGELVTAIRTLAGRGVGKRDRPRGRRCGQYGAAVSAAADRGGRSGSTIGAASDGRATAGSAGAYEG